MILIEWTEEMSEEEIQKVDVILLLTAEPFFFSCLLLFLTEPIGELNKATEKKQLFMWPRKCERNKRNHKKNYNFDKVTQTYYLYGYKNGKYYAPGSRFVVFSASLTPSCTFDSRLNGWIQRSDFFSSSEVKWNKI